MINYNDAAKTYDNTRNANSSILELFNNRVSLNEKIKILDFGCGTGNYLAKIKEIYNAQCFGIEPSDGMREKALEKNRGMEIKKGDHMDIPFEDNYFDFIYMTDVIHHVPDIDMLFKNLSKTLKKNGFICISTESHAQIETRWYNRYFPSLIKNEQKRYPDIGAIQNAAINNGLKAEINDVKSHGSKNAVTDEFIKMVEEKNYSMFRILQEEEFQSGLVKLKADRGILIEGEEHCETLVWFKKN